MKRPRLIIVDDHEMMVEGLVRLLGDGFEVVATLADGRRVVDDVCRLRPDAILLDLSIPHVSGFEVIRQLKARAIPFRAIVVTGHADPALAVESLRLGASAFVLKQSDGEELRKAVQVVLDGGTYLASQITKEAVLLMVAGGDPVGRTLPAPQREILRLIVRGQRAKQIAATLGVSTRTVEATKYRIMRRLQVHSTADLVRCAVERSLVSY